MWYWVLSVMLAGAVLVDARQRKVDRPEWWAAAALLFAWAIAPYYFSTRPLKTQETRTGGLGWNFCKAFAVVWTAFMAGAIVAAKAGTSAIVTQAGSSAEQTGTAFVSGVGMSMILGLWFFVLVGVIGIGAYLKKATVVEMGPTGPLADAAKKPSRRATEQ